MPNKTLRVILLALVLLIAACDQRPTDVPTPTRAPAEAASIFAGDLPGGAGQVGLVITRTRARALVCGTLDDSWRTLSGWLSVGTLTPSGDTFTIALSNPATGAKINAQLPVSGTTTITGMFTAPDGKNYPFAAAKITDASGIASGVEEGIYHLKVDQPPQGIPDKTDLYALVRDAKTGNACTVLMQGDTPLSRLKLNGIWQAGVSVFTTMDIKGSDNNPIVWYAPGKMGQIDSIAWPTS